MQFSKSSLKCTNQVLIGLLKVISEQKGFLFIFIVLKEKKGNYFYNDKKP